MRGGHLYETSIVVSEFARQASVLDVKSLGEKHTTNSMTHGFYKRVIDISIPERPKIIALVTGTRNLIDFQSRFQM